MPTVKRNPIPSLLSVLILAACGGGGGSDSGSVQPIGGALASVAGRAYIYGDGSVGEMSLRVAPDSSDGITLDAWVDLADGRTFAARLYEDMAPPSTPFTATDIEAVLIIEITFTANWAWSWLAMRDDGARLDYGLDALGGNVVFPEPPPGLPISNYTAASYWQ